MAILVAGQVVAAGGGVLLHLAENPWVSSSSAANHHRVAPRFSYDTLGIHGCLHVAVADDGNLHGLLYGGDQVPVGAAGVTLRAGARVHGDGLDTGRFGELRDLDGHDGGFVPAGAEFDGQRNAHCGAHGAENLFESREIAEEARPAAFHHFFGGAAEIDVHGVVAQVFHHFGGVGHDFRVGTKELRGDGVFVFLKI